MKGSIFAFMGGAFITLQGVANSQISRDIGSWQATVLTQFTGFAAALLIVLLLRDRGWSQYKHVKKPYLFGGAFAAIILFSNIVSIHRIGATLSISAILIAQLGMTVAIDANGWFGVKKRKMRLPHFVGLGLMAVGVVIMRL